MELNTTVLSLIGILTVSIILIIIVVHVTTKRLNKILPEEKESDTIKVTGRRDDYATRESTEEKVEATEAQSTHSTHLLSDTRGLKEESELVTGMTYHSKEEVTPIVLSQTDKVVTDEINSRQWYKLEEVLEDLKLIGKRPTINKLKLKYPHVDMHVITIQVESIIKSNDLTYNRSTRRYE